MNWFETNHCKCKGHCKKCRDKEGGRVWRTGIASHYEVDEVDFECPNGKKWLSKKEIKANKEVAAKPKKKKSGCKGCRERRKAFKELIEKQKEELKKAQKY